MVKRVCDVDDEPIPGASDRKRALYDAAVTQPMKALTSRTGVTRLANCAAALTHGCSLCVAPCRDETGSPSTAVFVLDHVHRVAFEVRAKPDHDPEEALCGGTDATTHTTPRAPTPPPQPRVEPCRGVGDSQEAALTFYEDVAKAPSPPLGPVQRQPRVEPCSPAPAPVPAPAASLPPAGTGSSVVPLDVTMPVDLLEKHRNALLYCHVCRAYIPPHVANLDAHLNAQRIHQRGQDYFIAEAVKSAALIDHTTGRPLSIHELANRQPKNAQRPPSLMVSGKSYEVVPTFIIPHSVITSEQMDADPSLRVFWEAGLDVVYPFCSFCEEAVSLQFLSAHRKKQKHIDSQRKEAVHIRVS